MFFNTRVFNVLALVVTPGMARDYSQGIVKQASDNGFLEYVMTNCIASALSKAVLGNTRLDAQTCLSTFNTNLNNPGSNKIDVADNACSQHFMDFITDLGSLSTTPPSGYDIFTPD
jgi:hypothetical protein